MNGINIAKRWQEALINQEDYMREMINKVCQEVFEGEFEKFIGVIFYVSRMQKKMKDS